MGLLTILRLGHPAIRAGGEVLTAGQCAQPAFQALVENMVDTMRGAHGVGIAAPQVGAAQQVIAVEVDPRNPRYPGQTAVPLTVLVNPKLISHSPDTDAGWEGCLSVPDLRGYVPRWRSVEVEAIDHLGRTVRISAEGFFARVLQHEIDHLHGKVFLDRLPDCHSLTHLREYEEFWVGTSPAPRAGDDT